MSTEDENTYPALPLRDVVVYPHMVIPLFVGRDKSVKALDVAMEGNKEILLVAQKSASDDDPSIDDIYSVGTIANILQLLKLPDGTIKVLVEGAFRASVGEFLESENGFSVTASRLESAHKNEQELEVLSRAVVNQFEQYVKQSNKIPPEVITSLSGIDDVSRLADTIAAHMTIKMEEKQNILEMLSIEERLEYIMGLMSSEMDMFRVEKRIRGRVKSQMEKSQREYYLNEQMKAIQKELGEMEDAPNEIEDLANKIETLGMPKEAKEKATAELDKLKMMSPMSAEATVVRNYIDWLEIGRASCRERV